MISTTRPTFAFERTTKSRIKDVDFNNLEFGKYISDHMLVVDFLDNKWQNPKIVPFGDIPMSPAMLSLHYGQSVFEGMKAFKNKNGDICIFRPQKHSERLNKSLARMCMPEIPEELFIQSLHAIVETDRHGSLPAKVHHYTFDRLCLPLSHRLGVKIADHFKFIILTSPAGAYFSKAYKVESGKDICSRRRRRNRICKMCRKLWRSILSNAACTSGRL